MKAQFKPRRGRKPGGCGMVGSVMRAAGEWATAPALAQRKFCLTRKASGVSGCAASGSRRSLSLMGIAIQNLHIGMVVRHPRYGVGKVKALTEHTADITFDDAPRTVDPAVSDLTLAEPAASVTSCKCRSPRSCARPRRRWSTRSGSSRPSRPSKAWARAGKTAPSSSAGRRLAPGEGCAARNFLS